MHKKTGEQPEKQQENPEDAYGTAGQGPCFSELMKHSPLCLFDQTVGEQTACFGLFLIDCSRERIAG